MWLGCGWMVRCVGGFDERETGRQENVAVRPRTAEGNERTKREKEMREGNERRKREKTK